MLGSFQMYLLRRSVCGRVFLHGYPREHNIGGQRESIETMGFRKRNPSLARALLQKVPLDIYNRCACAREGFTESRGLQQGHSGYWRSAGGYSGAPVGKRASGEGRVLASGPSADAQGNIFMAILGAGESNRGPRQVVAR
jgi:hypothetical protein